MKLELTSQKLCPGVINFRCWNSHILLAAVGLVLSEELSILIQFDTAGKMILNQFYF
jgi:hypothetical protein